MEDVLLALAIAGGVLVVLVLRSMTRNYKWRVMENELSEARSAHVRHQLK